MKDSGLVGDVYTRNVSCEVTNASRKKWYHSEFNVYVYVMCLYRIAMVKFVKGHMYTAQRPVNR